MWVAEFSECDDDRYRVLAVEIASANFGLSCRANDDIDDFAHGMDRTIERRHGFGGLRRIVGVGTEEKMSGAAASSMGFG